MQASRAIGFYQKYLNLCSKDERRSYRCGTTWGLVINDIIFIFGWTNPLRVTWLWIGPQWCGCIFVFACGLWEQLNRKMFLAIILWHALYFYCIIFNRDSNPTLTTKIQFVFPWHWRSAGNTGFTLSAAMIFHLICVSKQHERDTESGLMRQRRTLIIQKR